MKFINANNSFNQIFSQRKIFVNDTNIHYAIGGSGDALVLLHGFPQTGYAFRKIMQQLAVKFTVIVPDLRGLGDSDMPTSGYDVYTIADDIHKLVQQLGFAEINLLGHDFGGFVAYAYAASYRANVKKMVVLDIGTLDTTLENSPMLPRTEKLLWWFPFQMNPDLPEQLIAGKEEIYLNWFYTHSSFIQAAITKEDLQEYVRCYSKPGAMKAAFEYYREIHKDVDLNTFQAKAPLTIPVLTVGGEQSFGMLPCESWKQVATNVNGVVIKNCGHFVAEEQPQQLVNELIKFL